MGQTRVTTGDSFHCRPPVYPCNEMTAPVTREHFMGGSVRSPACRLFGPLPDACLRTWHPYARRRWHQSGSISVWTGQVNANGWGLCRRRVAWFGAVSDPGLIRQSPMLDGSLRSGDWTCLVPVSLPDTLVLAAIDGGVCIGRRYCRLGNWGQEST